MGLGASGKSSIRSVAFEGKSPEEVKDYSATINYTRSTKNIIDSAFQIFDCGGQESFISVFIGEQAEFIFSNVTILIWVVDVSTFDEVSTSKFYFDHAAKRLNQFSPSAEIFCLFHKVDLLLVDMLDDVMETMQSYFVDPKNQIKIHYYATSIFNKSIFVTIGDIIQNLILKNSKAKTVSGALQEFMKDNKELAGVAIYTADGLPVFEEGMETEKMIVPANLWLTNLDRLEDEFSSNDFKTTLETNNYLFVFQQIKSELLLSGIARKVSPLHYTLIKMEQLAELINKLI
jgi:GTPase SAR1 family protein